MLVIKWIQVEKNYEKKERAEVLDREITKTKLIAEKARKGEKIGNNIPFTCTCTHTGKFYLAAEKTLTNFRSIRYICQSRSD